MLEDSYHYFPFVNLDTLSPHSVTSWSAWWQRRPDNKVREERGQVLPGLKPTILSMVTLGTYRAMTQKLRKGTSPHSSSEKLQNKDRKPCVAWVCKSDLSLSLWPCNWPAVGAWKSHSSLYLATQSCPILFHPSGCTPPGFYIRGNFQARIQEWVVIFSSRGYFWPRDRTCISWVSCITGRFFTCWAIKEGRLEPSLV